MALARRTPIEPAVTGRHITAEASAVGASGAGVPVLPTSLLLLLAALSACITAQGGYYAGGQLVTGALLVAAFVSAARSHPLSRDDFRLEPVVAAVALGAWTVVSCLITGGEAVPVLVVLTGVVGVLLVCRRTSAVDRDGLATVLVGIGVLVALGGWVGVAWRLDALALEDQGLWRAATTLTYANASAGLLVPLVLLALGRQLTRRPSPLAAAVACLLLVGAGATLSRGGAVALTAGLVCLAALAGTGRTLHELLPAGLGALVALAGLLPSMPSSSAPRPALALLCLVAGVVTAAVLERAATRVLAATVLVALVATAALVAFGPLDGAGGSVSSARLTLASADREAQTSAALGLIAEHPLTGTGPGRATLFFTGSDGEALAARYVHNEYLQVLVELGAVGLALVVALLVALGRSVRAGRASASSPQLWAGAAAGLVALAVHSAFDFLWHIPALPLAGALLVGLTLSTTTTKEHA